MRSGLFVLCPRSDVIDRSPDAALPGAVSAAIECAFGLDPVADDLASAMIAHRRELVDGTLEAVESVCLTRGDHLKGEIVVVAADFASSHSILLAVGVLNYKGITSKVCPRGWGIASQPGCHSASLRAANCWARFPGLVPSRRPVGLT